MNIGELAKLSGVNTKLIRHYESIGLIPKATRSSSGYRVYKNSDIQFLSFIKKSRELGFSMKEIKKLLSLWKNKSRESKDVKSLVKDHITDLESKIETLQQMVKSLNQLAENCHGDSRPDCPILEKLEDT